MHYTTLLSCAAAITVVLTACNKPYQRVATFTEPDDPIALSAADSAAWAELTPGLHGAWADADLRYSRSLVPAAEAADTCALVAWRGERTSAQAILWAADSVDGITCKFAPFTSEHNTLPADIAEARFVRYTLTDSLTRVGGPTMIMPDMLDSLSAFDMAARTARPVWLTVSVPANATPGTYSSTLTVASVNGGTLSLPLTLEVQKFALADATDWLYHLDLWQHPAAVARAQGLEVWSDEHFEALKPVMKRLADAGQKVVTATLNKDPWNHQCYDAYEPMITWTRNADGSWTYNYDTFDRWVGLMTGLGIDKMINCYSMVPWNCELEYFDQAADSTVTVVAEPGTPIFEELWTPFLIDFKQHLAAKGWLEKTNIAMDERSPEAMDAAIKILEKCAPEMGFAIADNHQSYKKYALMRDVCVAQGQPADHSDILARRHDGYNTTFYVCCGPAYPNTFVNSQPYEAELLGWYGLAYDYDGMLRWAYNSWPADPQTDARHFVWNGGDTYLVYPYNRSSMRFERLIGGIQAAEKVRTLHRLGINTAEVDSVLELIRNTNVNDPALPWQAIVTQARQALNEASR